MLCYSNHCKIKTPLIGTHGNQIIKGLLCITGHIQIAQVPDRGEPDMNGEVNYKYIFQLLEDIGYDGFVGCEYKPRGKLP